MRGSRLKRRRRERGYLVLLVSVLVSVLTISFLRHAASAAQARSEAFEEEARTAALYAAESVLQFAEQRLPDSPGELPPPGTWRAFRLEGSQTVGRLELSYDPSSPETIIVTARSRAHRANSAVQFAIEAHWQYLPESGWVCRGRRSE